MDFVQQVETGVLSSVIAYPIIAVMSILLAAAARQTSPKLRETWSATLIFTGAAFLFLALGFTAYKIQQRPLHSWQPLTNEEVNNWTDALRSYQVPKVAILFIDPSQEDLVVGAGQVFRQAGWGEPSILPFNFSVGLQVRTGKDVAKAGRELQSLCEQKFGITVPFEDTAAPGLIQFYIGWHP